MIPYEILYNIYFYVDDYRTACNFWLLNKYFTKNYMTQYNNAYLHKFLLLLSEFDNFIDWTSPDNAIYVNKYILNRQFYDIKKDLFFVYNLNINFFIHEFVNKCMFDYKRKCSWCNLLIYTLFEEGSEHLQSIYNIRCNKNKITLVPRYDKKSELMEKCTLVKNFNCNYLKRHKSIIEIFFIG